MFAAGVWESASARRPSTERIATLGEGVGVGAGIGMTGVGATGDGPPQPTLKRAVAPQRRAGGTKKRHGARSTLGRGPRPRPGEFIEVL